MLAVTLIPASTEIYVIRDQTCPDGVASGRTCQIVLGRYDVDLDGSDPVQTPVTYQQATQDAIDNGLNVLLVNFLLR